MLSSKQSQVEVMESIVLYVKSKGPALFFYIFKKSKDERIDLETSILSINVFYIWLKKNYWFLKVFSISLEVKF